MKLLERASDFGLDMKDIPTMHGHTKIELKNVKTGLVERVESENTFQSFALANYLRTYGAGNSSKYNDISFKSRETWQSIVGGILLFRDPITVGAEFMPAGNKMIGQGAFEVSNGSSPTDPVEMGSWNSSSSASASAIAEIYDFTPEQANGVISCVSLTSRMGGLIGYGNSGNNVKGNYSLSTEQPIELLNYRGQLPAAGKYHVLAQITNGILTISKIRRNWTIGSVFEGYAKAENFDLETVGNPWNIVNSNSIYMQEVANGIYRFVPNGAIISVGPGENFYYYEYHEADGTLLLQYFVNPSLWTLNCGYNNAPTDYWNSEFKGPYAFCMNASDNTQLVIINMVTGVMMNALNGFRRFDYGGTTIGDLGNGMYVIPMDYRQRVNPNWASGQGAIVWDSISNDFKLIGLSQSDILTYSPSMNCLYGVGNGNCGIFSHPLYLATINNLNSPVTKTAAQSMRVIYTLTEV